MNLPRSRPWRTGKSGLCVLVRVTPGSAQDGIRGVIDSAHGPALKVHVRAIPEDGAANQAASEVVARWLGVARSSVRLAAGGKSRIKTLDIAGDPAALEVLLEARLPEC